MLPNPAIFPFVAVFPISVIPATSARGQVTYLDVVFTMIISFKVKSSLGRMNPKVLKSEKLPWPPWFHYFV